MSDQTFECLDPPIGDYFLHIYLQETRGLVSPGGTSSTIDPLVKISAFGQKQRTKAKDDRGTGYIYWGEHFFFEHKFMSAQELEVGKVKIEVIDYNLVGFNSLIGEYEFDLISIYQQKHHVFLHQWIALSNMKKDYENIKGFCKISLNLVGKGDKQVILKDEPLLSQETAGLAVKSSDSQESSTIQKSHILLPPSIKVKTYQLMVSLMKGENLIKMDTFGTIDPFVVVEFGSVQYATAVIKKCQNPIWGRTIKIPYSEPTINNNVLLKIYDWDCGKADELVGSCAFNKDDIHEGMHSKYFWLNIYGAQKDKHVKNNDIQAIMNSNPKLGTLWKGRILLSLDSIASESPKLTCEHLPQSEINLHMKTPINHWLLMIELYFGINFPSQEKSYGVDVRWADETLQFNETKGINGIWDYYSRKEIVCKFPYTQIDELPDLIIYLTDSSKRISYLRLPASHFQKSITPASLHSLSLDPAVSTDLRADQAGMIKFRALLGLANSLKDKSIGSWNAPFGKPIGRKGYLYANIYYAQDLLPADQDGTSDPFVVINYQGAMAKTQIIQETLNPI